MPSTVHVRDFIRSIGIDPETGQMPRQLNLNDVRDAVVADPDSAAGFVALCAKTENPPRPWAQIAIAVAAMYQQSSGDDSLTQLVESAPWARTMRMPTILGDDGKPMAMVRDDDADSPERLLILDINPGDRVEDAVERFRIEGKPKDQVNNLIKTWGRWMVAFTTSDEREIVDIAETRQFLSRLHAALPYFPVYLNMHPESGMFFLYFGCISERTALRGRSLDVAHQSVLKRVTESLLAIKKLCRSLGRNPEAMYRAMLLPYAELDITPMIKMLERAE